MLKLWKDAPNPEDLFIERYDRLLAWSLKISRSTAAMMACSLAYVSQFLATDAAVSAPEVGLSPLKNLLPAINSRKVLGLMFH